VREISSSTPLRDAGVTVMSLRQALALRGEQIEPYWTHPLVRLDHDKLKLLSQPQDIPAWFHDFRVKARDAYFDLELPGLKDEAWHYGDPRRFTLDGLDISRAEPGFNGARYERCAKSVPPPRFATPA